MWYGIFSRVAKVFATQIAEALEQLEAFWEQIKAVIDFTLIECDPVYFAGPRKLSPRKWEKVNRKLIRYPLCARQLYAGFGTLPEVVW